MTPIKDSRVGLGDLKTSDWLLLPPYGVIFCISFSYEITLFCLQGHRLFLKLGFEPMALMVKVENAATSSALWIMSQPGHVISEQNISI